MQLTEGKLTLAEPARGFDLDKTIETVAHLLPTQGPLKDFIHHNTLHAFQHLPFFEGVDRASAIFGASGYPSLRWFHEQHAEGKLERSALVRAILRAGYAESDVERIASKLLTEKGASSQVPGFPRLGVRVRWRMHYGVHLDTLVHPMLFRYLSSFLDQGISLWQMPETSGSFWQSVQRLVSESFFPSPPLSSKPCREILKGTSRDAIHYCLGRIIGNPEFYESYLTEMCLSHPGWSGMVRVLEKEPGSLLSPRNISLQDTMAIELLLEHGWLARKLGAEYRPLSLDVTHRSVRSSLIEQPSNHQDQQILLEAVEWTLYRRLMRDLEKNSKRVTESTAKKSSVAAFFCIDDRECSVRRHLEVVEPSITTFATAGFYGVDILFQAEGSSYAVKHCPVVVNPKHVIREITKGDRKRGSRPPKMGELFHLGPRSSTLFRGWLLTQTLGVVACLRLAWNVFRPVGGRVKAEALSHAEPVTDLKLKRTADEQTPEGYLPGFTTSEMVDRVAGVLKGTGYGENFANLMVFFGHGASSANNPHFAAYNCGACSGRVGAPNARAFAFMANDPMVRKGLMEQGIHVPDSCHFVGALHDTTRDEVTYFDTHLIPASRREAFDYFQKKMNEALAHNAKERCNRFDLAPKNPTPKKALQHVRMRASSLFEPRPELNHANNAFAIIGRRDLTRGLFLDRRAFLNSYDPLQDQEGKILQGILNAAVPVCGGINLEYYFSRVDNDYYGAGTKLPHNVVSLLGVANGVEGDLQTGLPSQMIELHDPVRLLMVIEQEPNIILNTLARMPAVFEWIQNSWVNLACFSPSERRSYFFDGGLFTPVDTSEGAQ